MIDFQTLNAIILKVGGKICQDEKPEDQFPADFADGRADRADFLCYPRS